MKKLLMSTMLAVVLATTGCSTKTNSDAERLKYTAVLKSQEAANRPLFEMECPESGCVFKKLSVANPDPKMLKLPKETNGWDVANKVVGAVTTLTPWIIVGQVAKAGIDKAGDTHTNSNNTSNTSSNESVNNSHNDGSSSSVDSSSSSVETNSDSSTNSSNTESYSDAYNSNEAHTTNNDVVFEPEPEVEVEVTPEPTPDVSE